MPIKRGAVFAQAGAEYHSNWSSQSRVVGRDQTSNKSFSFGAGFGGGVDYSLTRRVTVRLVQINLALPFIGEGPGRNVRLKSGVVLKF